MQWSCPLERVGETHLFGRYSSDDGKDSLAGNTGRNSIPTIRKHTGSYRGAPFRRLGPTDAASIDGRSTTRITGHPGPSHGLFLSTEYCLIAASKKPPTLLSLYGAPDPRPAAAVPSTAVILFPSPANAETRMKAMQYIKMKLMPEENSSADPASAASRRGTTMGDA
jgi:hypothetical protein